MSQPGDNEKFFLFMIILFLASLLIWGIGIPKMHSYRNKSFCIQTKSDAYTVAAAIADYFSDPSIQLHQPLIS